LFLLVFALVQEEQLFKDISQEDVTSFIASKIQTIKIFLMEISYEISILIILLIIINWHIFDPLSLDRFFSEESIFIISWRWLCIERVLLDIFFIDSTLV